MTAFFFANSTMTLRLRFSVLSATALLTLSLGQSALAADSGATITRGVFLRAMVKALMLETPDCRLPYRRAPASMTATLCAAYAKKALALWPDDASLLLSRPITRGEAILILTSLTNANETEDVRGFRDVKTDTEKKAVMNAVALQWLRPKRTHYFGLSAPLTSAEAKNLAVILTGSLDSETITPLPNRTLLDTIWRIIDRDYLYRNSIDLHKLTEDTADALVQSLKDPYTRYFRPDDARLWKEEIHGTIPGGIGANVEIFEGNLRVVSPLPGSPAERAGLQPGDLVTHAGDTVLAGMSLEKAITFIRGKPGTEIVLTILRGSETIKLSITREVITIPDVTVTSFDGVPVVRLMQFGEYADREIENLFKTIAEQNPRGVVLDLRNNPGGLLSTAIKVAGIFLPKDSVVTIVKDKNSSTVYKTMKAPILPPGVSVAVLINNGSASASEIVAAALKDAKRATLVGAKTFGKGTVQEVIDFETGDALKLTIAEFFSPLGTTINKTGIEPDYLVQQGSAQSSLAQYGINDPQLQKAIDLVR